MPDKKKAGRWGALAVIAILAFQSIEHWTVVDTLLAALRGAGGGGVLVAKILISPLLPLALAIAALLLAMEGNREKTTPSPAGEQNPAAVNNRSESNPTQKLDQTGVKVETHYHLLPQPEPKIPLPPPKTKEKKPNLVIKKSVYLGTLYLLGEIWSRTCLPDLHQPVPEFHVIYAEIKNAGKQGEEVGPAHDVKAELVIGEEEFIPLPWLDEWYNAVQLEFGTVKYVVLAVDVSTNSPQQGDWRVVINHRDYSFAPGVASMDFDHSLHRLPNEQKIKLNLLHVKTGTILNSFDGVCRWKDGLGIPQIYFE